MRWLVLLLIITIPLGGCQLETEEKYEGNSETLPKGKAFEDDFTLEFIASEKEVEDGYYEFKSKTGMYTMLFPRNAIMSKMVYQNPSDTTETLEYYVEDDAIAGEINNFRIWHTQREKIGLEAQLLSVAQHVGYEGDFEKKEDDERIIHMAKMFDELPNRSFLSIFGSVYSKVSHQNVNYLFTVTYKSGDDELNEKKVEKHVQKLVESIEFSS